MKRRFVWLLVLLLAVACSALAERETSGDFTYIVLEDGTAEITDWFAGLSDTLTIPS